MLWKKMEQYYQQQLLCLCKNVHPANQKAKEESRRRWDKIAKPLYGLGLLSGTEGNCGVLRRQRSGGRGGYSDG